MIFSKSRSFLLSLFFFGLAISSSAQASVVINQVYGGGGNSGAVYTNDFIELFNSGTSSINIKDWSLQYASSSGTSWTVISLPDFDLEPKSYYLIELSGGEEGSPLPLADLQSTLNISSSSGKVILCTDPTQRTESNPEDEGVIDKVGYGRANSFEGTEAAPSISNTTAIVRVPDGTDTDSNFEDFIEETPNPRNSSPTVTAVFEKKKRLEVVPYPNPAKNSFIVKSTEKVEKILVTDINGRQEIFHSNQVRTRLKGNLNLTIHTQNQISYSKVVVY